MIPTRRTHTARSTLLATVVPFAPETATFGQYAGYRGLDDVADDSDVETFAAVRTTIDNDRWRDVPVTIRTGKALAANSTAATITLRPNGAGVANSIRFEVKPDASVTFGIARLDPSTHEPTPVAVDVCGPDDHGALGDYAVMLDNALVARRATSPGSKTSWGPGVSLRPSIPGRATLVTYEPGTDGPTD